MKVYLAGYNVDADVLDELKEQAQWKADNITPESLSASYARISRDSRDINVLRKVARNEIEAARKSNESIIFGFGHHSVAEHACFNFDVIDLSRLAVEEVQHFRLASFTEKSQRYITLEGDYYTPENLPLRFQSQYKEIIELQVQTYEKLYEKLKNHLFEKHTEKLKEKFGDRTVDGWAKEDARYVLSLATHSQFGMTVNARTLELMLRRMGASKLKEVNQLADSLFDSVKDLCPSIIKFTEASDHVKKSPEEIQRVVSEMNFTNSQGQTPAETLVHLTSNPDDMLCAAILYHYNEGHYYECVDKVKSLSSSQKESIVKASLSHRAFYDSVDRTFELIDCIFDLTVSATNYAQLKRHRMSTQIIQDYNSQLGYTVPDSIKEIGLEDLFCDCMLKTEELYGQIIEEDAVNANYILTNAHRRRVLVKMNARELYHFINLREDEHAQWDIRMTAEKMRLLLEEKAPLTFMMLCGKDTFHIRQSEIFGI